VQKSENQEKSTDVDKIQRFTFFFFLYEIDKKMIEKLTA